ncbi:DUF6088 family protein [Achromobacter aloeverae]
MPQAIVAAAQALPEGGVLTPREFLHLGGRAAVDQAFSRLARQGRLLRLCRGLYAAPVPGRFGSRAPAPEKVMQELERRTGESLVPSGAAEANRLGLSRQMPVREVYLSSGPQRRLHFGKSVVQIQHVQPQGLFLAKNLAGAAARAVKWLGPQHVTEVLRKLHKRLPGEDWLALVQARGAYPSWMAKAIGSEMANG